MVDQALARGGFDPSLEPRHGTRALVILRADANQVGRPATQEGQRQCGRTGLRDYSHRQRAASAAASDDAGGNQGKRGDLGPQRHAPLRRRLPLLHLRCAKRGRIALADDP